MRKRIANYRRMFVESLQSRCVFAAYFIDLLRGSDSNSGLAPDAALATPAELVSYYNYADRPAGYKGLQPGDEVVLMPGVHDFTYRYDQTTRGFFLRGVHGTADAPIVIRGMPGAQVRSKASDGSELAPIALGDLSLPFGLVPTEATIDGYILDHSVQALRRDYSVEATFGCEKRASPGVKPG